MGLAVAAFVWAALLQPGDRWGYALVAVLSAAALGPDLVMPPALLAGVIRAGGHGNRLEGSYFGVRNFATKLNLAAGCRASLAAAGAARQPARHAGNRRAASADSDVLLVAGFAQARVRRAALAIFVRDRSGPATFAS
ncbi:MAG: hypothetical protein PHO64_14615 [Thiomonas sp.]|nr:hypothetical protein [Thiomonas sp.]